MDVHTRRHVSRALRAAAKVLDAGPQQDLWYMGRDSKLSTFTTNHVGSGNDQLGPGLYFGSTPDIARMYGSKIHVCTIKWRKKLKPYGPVNQDLLAFILDGVPDWESENEEVWGLGSGEEAKARVFDSYDRYSNLQMISSMQGTVMYYRDSPQKLVARLAKKYTGFIAPAGATQNNAYHNKDNFAVVYDPKAIQLVEVIDRKDLDTPE